MSEIRAASKKICCLRSGGENKGGGGGGGPAGGIPPTGASAASPDKSMHISLLGRDSVCAELNFCGMRNSQLRKDCESPCFEKSQASIHNRDGVVLM